MSLDFNANHYRGRGLPFVDEQEDLGCVMLDTADPILSDPGSARLRYILGEVAHTSDRPERFWIKGIVGASETSHVTLLYGLLPAVRRAHVDVVLDGWDKPPALLVDHVGVFPSPYPDEPYACLVAHLQITDALREAHARLSMLPHLDTYPEYKAHVTIGYVQTDADVLEHLVRRLNGLLKGQRVPTGELNYGKALA